MKRYFYYSIFLLFAFSCSPKLDKRIENSMAVIDTQLTNLAKVIEQKDSSVRSYEDGKYRFITARDWTSGFVPGTYWLAYQLTGKEEFKDFAKKLTSKQKDVPSMAHTHDLGFMVFCSYGKQWEVEKDSVSLQAIITASNSLCGRMDSTISAIRSWDFGKWNYPVIIDNMMNLEMLFWLSEQINDSYYKEIAIKHADKTMSNHFRPDYSTYHVVSYNNDGSVESKGTYQGYSDDSYWARGQAWALYGYTVAYDYSKKEEYLNIAKNVAKLIMNHPNMPQDGIPYWDYIAPTIPNAPRDASAAAVTASALIELSTIVGDDSLAKEYFNYAEKILINLLSPEYLAKAGENGGFILKHSTGAAPMDSEVDIPINYADYYFLEAIKRYCDFKGISFIRKKI